MSKSNARPLRVFVHLARGFDARNWEQRWSAGRIIGINERFPYGYFRAAEDGCEIRYAENKTGGKVGDLLSSWLRAATSVDILHAWRNRKEIFACEVVWTHTEIEYLAVLLLFEILFWRRPPKLIAQSIWLFDRWYQLSWPSRLVLSYFLKKADVLTVHSPENLKAARAIFPAIRSELVLFGITTDQCAQLKQEKAHRPIRLFSLGNDPHRDWLALAGAVKDLDCHLKIASRTVTKTETGSCPNIEILTVTSNSQLLELFEWADLVIVALKPNLHASGTTVIQEAALRGVAVICTDTGGLRAYFSGDEVYYVPGGEPAEIRKAIRTLSADDALRWGLAARAQERMKKGDLSSRSFARRHAELSRELLAGEAVSPLAAKTG